MQVVHHMTFDVIWVYVCKKLFTAMAPWNVQMAVMNHQTVRVSF